MEVQALGTAEQEPTRPDPPRAWPPDKAERLPIQPDGKPDPGRTPAPRQHQQEGTRPVAPAERPSRTTRR